MTDRRIADAGRALDAGDRARAIALATAVADDATAAAADRSLALRLRADARASAGDRAGARDDARAAVALAPQDARAWNALGIAEADAAAPERAAEAFARATALDPRYARAWNNLGNALGECGRGDEARSAYERAVAVDPRYAFGWANLAVARRDAGDDDGALDAARRALALDPAQRAASLLVAGFDRRAGRLDPAIAAYERALAARPADAPVRYALAGALAERDDLAAAREHYRRAARDDPALLRARLGAALTLPMIVESEGAQRAARVAYAAGLERLTRELPDAASRLPAGRVLDELRWTNFLLAYQGEDDTDLQRAYGDLVAATLAAAREPLDLAPAPTAGGRRRVVFVGGFFRDGTAGRYFERWITDLDRDRFEVVVHDLALGGDALTARLRARADRYVSHGAEPTAAIARSIAREGAHAIVYPELGMNATAFALASLRLAPFQAAGWGHPVTSGLATVDAMFTAGAMEPPGAQAQYRERLVELPGLGTRYARPAPPPPATRSSLGLPEDGALVLFPQSLFKLHPDDDRRLARVLAAAPGARAVAFAGRHPRLTARWRARLDPLLDAHGVDARRVLVLPQGGHSAYLAINRACDLMLDSVRWSGGNTSLDAIACGLPVVTHPGRTMRARQSAAMLQLAGLPELVAGDEEACVATAARLLADAGERADLARRLDAGAHALFDDPAPVAAFADALERG